MSNSVAQNCVALQNQIQELLAQRAEIRRRERDMKLREELLSGQAVVRGGTTLKDQLRTLLPTELQPRNLGGYTESAWPFWYPLDFDFGTDPTLTSETRQEQSVQVSQEAAFILTTLSLDAADNDNAAYRGPYQVTIRDAQSSRQLNDNPIPIQMIGTNSNPTKLHTGYLFMPNARIRMEVSTWIPAGTTMPAQGDGRFQFLLSGIRIRLGDLSKTLSTAIVNY